MRPVQEHRNNFDLLRFLFAASVLLFHLSVLSQFAALYPLQAIANGTYAVLGFFSISGYVVTLSWHRCANTAEYLKRRARRILPAYFTVVLFWWAAGALISSLPAREYWFSWATWRYLAANVAFLQFLGPDLPGVFASNPHLSAVNGSLWSIRSELLCYVLLPLSVRWRASAAVAILCGVAGTALGWVVSADPRIVQLRIGLANPLLCFFLGSWLAQKKPESFLRPLGWAAGIGFSLLVYQAINPHMVFLEPGWQGFAMPAAIASAVLGCGFLVPYLGDWRLPGDLSYGIYLWSFPLIQLVLGQHWLSNSPWIFAGLCGALTLLAAAFSWFRIERRFLRNPVQPARFAIL